ncbi:MAG TPA: energy transducer TonB, partial [Bacteroidia bacterium]
SAVIRMGDELADTLKASYHVHIYNNRALLEFLENGKVSESLFSRGILHNDKNFKPFISIPFAESYASALLDAVKKGDHTLTGKLLCMPFPVEAEQIQTAYGKSHRFLEKWNEEITAALERVNYGMSEEKKRQLKNDPFLAGIRTIPDSIFKIKGNFAEGFLSLFSQVCNKGKMLWLQLNRTAYQQTYTTSSSSSSSTASSQNKNYQYRSTSHTGSKSDSGNGGRIIYAVLLVLVIFFRALIGTHHSYSPTFDYTKYNNLHIPNVNFSDTSVLKLLRDMYNQNLKASQIAESLKDYYFYHSKTGSNNNSGVYSPETGSEPFQYYLGKYQPARANAMLVFVNKSKYDVVAFVSTPVSSKAVYVRKNDSLRLDDLAKSTYEVRFYFGNDWSLDKTHIKHEPWEDSYSLRTNVPKIDSVPGRFRKVPLNCITPMFYAVLSPESDHYDKTRYARFVLKGTALIKQTGGWMDTPVDGTLKDADAMSETMPITPNEDYVSNPDIQAEFPGGTAAMISYIQHNIYYPEMAKDNGISGRVFVSFYIDALGKVQNPTVLKSASPMLDSEALRVIRNMPRWTAAKKNGLPVSSKMVIPINFKLN